MRKLTYAELNACNFLAREGSYFLSEFEGPATPALLAVFDSLVKKKRAVSEAFDGGVRYPLTAQGAVDAAP